MTRRSELTTRQQANVRMRINQSASMVVDKLVSCVAGTGDLSPAQLKAADLLLQRTVPTLQSLTHEVEQVKPISEADAMARLAVILRSNPELAPRIIQGEVESLENKPDAT